MFVNGNTAIEGSGGSSSAGRCVTVVLGHTTFRERMAGYPLNVEMLSRFRTAAQAKAIQEGLKGGTIDIIIGTWVNSGNMMISRTLETLRP